jgi:hypothetical protein
MKRMTRRLYDRWADQLIDKLERQPSRWTVIQTDRWADGQIDRWQIDG